MTYICIKCRKTWVKGGQSEGPSGGLCPECTADYVRSKQMSEGNKPCYRTAVECCSEPCKWWPLCMTDSGLRCE